MISLRNTNYKKIIYIDLDGVLADFQTGVESHPLKDLPKYQENPDLLPGLFAELPLIPGAKEAVQQLSQDPRFELYILSTAPWDNPGAWTDKRLWIEKHFGVTFRKRLVLSHRKDLLIGDYLIDDMDTRFTRSFQGEWLRYGGEDFPDWRSIVEYIH
jgi:5'(3')-deoxyribonucleotidase